jgi:tRNA threonylcarbamoyladenosine biosynthesis protein TsaE
MVSLSSATENETLTLASKLAKAVTSPCFITLNGQLGAGKTTFSRGFLTALGHKGHVKSPTYTIVEPYELNDVQIFHFDLYRIQDTEELELLGLRDYFQKPAIILMEWSEHGAEILPTADINCNIRVQNAGRFFEFKSGTLKGQAILQQISR